MCLEMCYKGGTCVWVMMEDGGFKEGGDVASLARAKSKLKMNI
jgi:hypothetical protein